MPRMVGKRGAVGAGLVDVIEAAYAPAPSEEAWVRAVVEAARPLLDQGLGCGGYQFDARDPDYFRCTTPVTIGGPNGLDLAALSVEKNHQDLRREVMNQLFLPGVPFGSMAERMQAIAATAELAEVGQLLAAVGAVDILGSISGDPSRRGLCLIALLPRQLEAPARVVRQWARVTTHIAAGLRLLHAESDACEAVLEPDGRVVHAEEAAKPGAAREELRRAAKAVDRARGRLRREDPSEALDLWRGLVDGRWSLVDRFESDGRRYVVARRNDPLLPDPRALTLRERQVVGFVALGQANKLVAYALGITESAVSTHLTAAMRKLAVRTRSELVAFVGALRDPGATPAGEGSPPA